MVATEIPDTDRQVTYAPSHHLQSGNVEDTSSPPFTSSGEKVETPFDANCSMPSGYKTETRALSEPIISPIPFASASETHLDDPEPPRTHHLMREVKLYKARVDMLYNLDATPVSETGVTRLALGMKPGV
jgi:hypothetical protein